MPLVTLPPLAQPAGRVLDPAGRVVGLPAPDVLARDRFARIDSTTTLGQCDTGQAWVPAVGTWGIASGRAKCITNVHGNHAYLEAGSADGLLSCVVNGVINSNTNYHAPELVARWIDSNNYLRAWLRASTPTIQKMDAGAATTLVAGAIASPDLVDVTLALRMQGPRLVFLVNGKPVAEHVLSAANAKYIAPTKHGIRLSFQGSPGSQPARWANWQMRSLG